MLTVKIIRDPYRSTAHPITGERTIEAIAPMLTAPAIKVLLHPKASAMGDKKIPSTKTEGAIRANTVVPAANTTIQP
jgi:hypothetical protein